MKSSLAIAIGHLNAPFGPLLQAGQLRAALKAGTVSVLGDATGAAALVGSMFDELSPDLILACAAEAGASLEQIAGLYREALADGMPAIPAWEELVGYLS